MDLTPARLLVVALTLLSAYVVGGCSDSTPTAPARPTPIGKLDANSLAIARTDFCALVPARAVHRAVGGGRTRPTSWGNGDTAVVGRGSTRIRDVVAEHGCAWQSRRDPTRRASAWVFARPVDRADARRIVAAGARQAHCRRVAGPRFGRPTLTQVCHLTGPKRVRVRHAGLFDRSWLTCQVAADRSVHSTTRLAGAWCVSVASALDRAG